MLTALRMAVDIMLSLQMPPSLQCQTKSIERLGSRAATWFGRTLAAVADNSMPGVLTALHMALGFRVGFADDVRSLRVDCNPDSIPEAMLPWAEWRSGNCQVPGSCMHEYLHSARLQTLSLTNQHLLVLGLQGARAFCQLLQPGHSFLGWPGVASVE